MVTMVKIVNKAVAIVAVVWHVQLSMEAVRVAVLLDGSAVLVIKVRLHPSRTCQF